MAPATSYILFLSIFSLAFALEAAQPRQSNISLETSLHPTINPTSWLSPNGRFAFGFYPEGTGFSIGTWLVASPENNTVIWTADRDEPPVTKDAALKLTNNGLELLLPQSEARVISQISTNTDASSASMLDSGNLVIYDSNFNVVWQTFDHPTDTIMADQMPLAGNELVSRISESNHSRGRFQLSMQDDGNLVLYPVASSDSQVDAYWASGTNGMGFQSLTLDRHGRLYLFNGNATDNLTDSLPKATALVYRATLGVDGIFRLVSHDLESNAERVLEEFPKVADPCEVKGTCGVNSYCTSAKGRVVCSCPPGFDYLDTKSTSSGCSRNITTIGCSLNDDNTTYMSPLENATWTSDSYAASWSVTSKEECSDACLKDCNCAAALLQDGTCSKQALPMRYGRTDSTATTFIKLVNLSAGGRPDSSHGDRGPAAAPVTATKQKFSATILFVSVAIAAGIVSTLAAFIFFFYRHRAGRYRRMGRNREPALVDEIAPRCFSYHELREATQGSKEELGKGAFGTVFKGTLPSGERAIAVKKLEKVVDEGEREFRREMRTIGRTHHKNLVRLLGFCDEGANRLLVYEYMSNGSLADLIFKADRHPDWDERVRIALDIAKGIHYLHEDCETRIIHCDIKPENILMDDNWTAKISDFGLAKLLMPSQTRTFTGIRGTRGYLAPEWHKNAPISVKADVYSFGIVLLEIVCCRRNMELEAEEDAIILLDWVHDCFMNGELEMLVPDEVDTTELNRLVKVGLWCIQSEPGSRPSMKNVVMMLEGNVGIPLPPPPGFSS
ncbi:G-type lectin S-receptor-like serine/threonine-protein kinase LECRK2 [Phoenix dactylifera]|uniref:Receptor-like serine/threonine-protein kinase n=1 Tax=Phoenix dactylifera TaxID=42345 RepID=A0A8B7BL01_PHODC|nr:G-type lectin S-receptor-like serine/threonine-protein kinase LECRK2 [Phoenix dactylifera]